MKQYKSKSITEGMAVHDALALEIAQHRNAPSLSGLNRYSIQTVIDYNGKRIPQEIEKKTFSFRPFEIYISGKKYCPRKLLHWKSLSSVPAR
jgi:hypothetical protein